ncbi:MAG: hypothetical protein ABWX60_11460, partial [Aeromicrobium sp.]
GGLGVHRRPVRAEVHDELLVDVLFARGVERAGLLDRGAVVEGAVEPAVQALDVVDGGADAVAVGEVQGDGVGGAALRADVGDDLVPGEPKPFVDPDTCDERLVADAAIDALAIMTNESARLRDAEIELHEVIQDLMGQLDRFHATRTYKAKERMVAMSRTNPLARAGLSVYRRLRGRSSRST